MPRTVVSMLLILVSALLVGAQSSSSSAQSPTGATTQSAAPQTAPQQGAQVQKRPKIAITSTNLKVLPTDIQQDDLLTIMKAFCKERKIRCSQCHAVNDDLTEGEFASDDKPAKIAAREFLKTVFDARAKYPNEAKVVPVTK